MSITTTFKCDRCGNKAPRETVDKGWIDVSIGGARDDDWDLCETCWNALFVWFDMLKEKT